METTFFGLIETKSFNFLRIIINGGGGGGGGGGREGVPVDPLNPSRSATVVSVSCRCNVVIICCFKILHMHRSI